MSCPDLCTAAKCAELEQQINDLKIQLEIIHDLLIQHLSQPIPDAHVYIPELKIEQIIEVNEVTSITELVTDIYLDETSAQSRLELPDSLVPSVTFDIFNPSPNEYIFKVGVNGEFDEDYLILEPPVLSLTAGISTLNELEIVAQYGEKFIETSTPLPRYDVALDIFETSPDTVAIVVQVGEEREQATLFIPQSNNSEHVVSNLKINGSYQNDYLTLTIADGDSFDSTQIYIDATEINNFGGGDSNMECGEKIDLCCSQILNALGGLSTQLSNAESILNQSIDEVFTQVTIDVSSTVCSDYKCEFPLDDDEEIIPTYAEATLVEKEFTGKGIAGINERLKYLAANQDAMYKEICKAVPPPIDIPLNQTLTDFCTENGLKTADDFDDDEGFFDYIKNQVLELLKDSILSALVKRLTFIPGGGAGAFVVKSTMQWAIGWLIEKSKTEEVQGLKTICEAIAELEQDTVTLVAQEQDIGRVEGNVLVLHFVTLDNYPKRTKGSSPRIIRIPAPKENLSWNTDFANIRWQTGNQYAKLKLEGWKQGITGWFKDADAANTCFDQLIQLTTAEEKGRNIPNHTDGRSDIVVRIERPYRAFLAEETTPGNARTLTKFYPPNETE